MGSLSSAFLPVTVPNDQNLDPGEKAEIWSDSYQMRKTASIMTSIRSVRHVADIE